MGTAYPEHGKIRTISILSIVTKLYELVLQQKLQAENVRLNFIPKNQLGFSRRSIGTQEHLLTLSKLMIKSIKKQREYRRNHIPVADRITQWVLAIDFKSAFDKLDRKLLLEKMEKGGYDRKLIKAIGMLLQQTSVCYDGTRIETKRGCPQGSCLSPDLWNIGMADLCEELDGVTSNESQEKATALCFCDDVLIFA